VASIYVPNGGKDFDAKVRFLEALERYAARGGELLLCGDLNVALEPRDVHPELANEKQIGQTKGERELLQKIIGHGLVDLLRHFSPGDSNLFTWWAPWRNFRDLNVGWRLDYVLASGSLAAKAKSCRAEREFGQSDHGPVTAVFQGPLFDPSKVIEGAPQAAPPKEAPSPQLSLF
jgi:exodeoxyribonuclease-3